MTSAITRLLLIITGTLAQNRTKAQHEQHSNDSKNDNINKWHDFPLTGLVGPEDDYLAPTKKNLNNDPLSYNDHNNL